jgi:hypothetical protein
LALALLLLPARSADGKKSLLPFGCRGGIESGLLNAPRLSILLLGFAGGLSCSLGRFRGCSLCSLACYLLASDPLSFRKPDVAGGDDLRSGLYSPQPGGVFRNCPGTFNLSLLRSAVSCPTRRLPRLPLSATTWPHVNRAGFEIAGDVLEFLRHPLQHLGHFRLMRQACQPARMLGPFAVVTRRMHIPSTGASPDSILFRCPRPIGT